MRITRTIAGSAVAIALAGSVAVAAPASASTTAPKPATTTCTPSRVDHWPAYAQGRPHGLDAGDRGGVYLWHDASGWHLRVTHRSDRLHVYSGTIATRGVIRFQRVADERADKAWVGRDHHTLGFVFTNYGRMDGVDFQTACAPSLAMSFRGDGHALPANRVNVGVADRHPAAVPFVISRVS
jgi:hypothetical protein